MAKSARSINKSSEAIKALMLSDDARFLEAIYWIFLGREVDLNGKRSYLARLRQGHGRAFIMKELSESKEAKGKSRPVPAKIKSIIDRGCHPFILDELSLLEDRAFLELAYRTILHRDADLEGLQYYMNALLTKTTRTKVLSKLRRAPEGRRTNAHVPEIDRAITNGIFQKIKVLKRFILAPQYGETKSSIHDSLRRIESSLFEFRNSELGERLATASAQNGGASFWTKNRSLGDVSQIDEKSQFISGNVALSAKFMAQNDRIKRILILKLDHIGDFFVSVRPMVMLREAWPDAFITLVCGPWNIPLAERLGIFDEVLPYHFFNAKTGDEEFNWEAKDWTARCDGIRELKLGAYDLAIDLRHDSDTRPILTRIDSKIRVGFSAPGGPLPSTPPLDLFLLEIPPNHRDQLHAETRLIALAALTIETFCPPLNHPVRRLVDKSNASGQIFGERPYIVIAPGAGSPNRTWPARNFTALMQKALAQWGFGLVLIGPKGEAPANETIAAQFSPDDCINLTGGALTDLPALIDNAVLYIGNDTGGGHLAAMMGTPTLSIYAGVSDPRVWQPIGPRVSIVHSKTPCSYCHLNLRKDCHFELRCLSEITVEKAWSELINIFENSKFNSSDKEKVNA